MFLLVFKAYVSLTTLDQGKEIHYHVVEIVLDYDVYVANALIDKYAKCQFIKDALTCLKKFMNKMWPPRL
jgi:hypothetical protein